MATLRAACASGPPAQVSALLSAAGDGDVGAADGRGWTPLHTAAARPGPDGAAIVALLLAAGADPDAETGEEGGGKAAPRGCDADGGSTALHIAAALGHAASVDALLPVSDADAEDGGGSTCAMVALRAGHGALARALATSDGADVDAACAGGETLLHAAAGSGDAEAVAWLLAAGADAGATDARRDTPAHRAAAAGHFAVAASLVEARGGGGRAGEVVNQRGQKGCTLLHLAAAAPDGASPGGRAAFVERVLALGGDAGATNGAHERPADLVGSRGRQRGDADVLDLLSA